MAVETPVSPPTTDPATGRPDRPRSRSKRAGKGRTPFMRFLVWSHRWTALVLGLVLVAITTSGALLVYEPEWTKITNPTAFHSTESARPITPEQALDTVQEAHPTFGADDVVLSRGIYIVSNAAKFHEHYGVDPGTGDINGRFTSDVGVMGLMVNLHECGLSCEDYPGYLPVLGKTFHVPAWLGYEGGATGAGLGLAVLGLLLMFLAISGAVLWFPTVKKWAHWARVRFGRGRYARDYDLHNIVGFVAVPFLLMWGFTGASFEVPAFDQAWHAITHTDAVPDEAYTFESDEAPKGTPDIGLDAAVTAAEDAVEGTATDMTVPTRDAPYYSIYINIPNDSFTYAAAPGGTLVYVDRHDASHVKVPVDPAEMSWVETLWDSWRYGTLHYGYAVNTWWRLPWFLFGLVPILLMWTGVSTWLYTVGVKRRRRKAAALRKQGEVLPPRRSLFRRKPLRTPDPENVREHVGADA